MQRTGVNVFQIGETVKRVPFVDSTRGEFHQEIPNLTVISTRQMPEEKYRGNQNFLHYQRIEAEDAKGWIYEGGSHFFELQA